MRFDESPSGQFVAQNVPVALLIRLAYADFQMPIEGAPDWVNVERFEVRAATGVAQTQALRPGEIRPLNLMMRASIAERFQMVSHRIERETPVYLLELSRTDRSFGPRLTVAMPDCVQPYGAAIGPGTLRFGSTSMANLAGILSGRFGRRVIDNSGLTGDYALGLEFTPPQPPPPGVAPVNPDGPSVFTALQEQLGLRLVATNAPVGVLVIDRIQRPSPD